MKEIPLELAREIWDLAVNYLPGLPSTMTIYHSQEARMVCKAETAADDFTGLQIIFSIGTAPKRLALIEKGAPHVACYNDMIFIEIEQSKLENLYIRILDMK